MLGICWCVLSGPRKLTVGNYEEGWNRIDGEEQAMAADGGSWMEWSGRRFGRLQEEANGSLMSFWDSLIMKRRRIFGEEENQPILRGLGGRRSDLCRESNEKLC